MNPADEIHILLEQLTATWGSVAIACDQHTCAVSDGSQERVFEAAPLLDALRLAVEAEQVQPWDLAARPVVWQEWVLELGLKDELVIRGNRIVELEAELRDDHLDDFDGLDDDPPCVTVTPERVQAMREVLGLLRPYGALECDGAVVLSEMLREMEECS